MTKTTISQSQKRFKESVGALFDETKTKNPSCLFLKSSSDIGVIRNGGRNGARFAPQAFLASFKKFSQDESVQKSVFMEFEVSSEEEELLDFDKAQNQEAKRILDHLTRFPRANICHLGGGHDHVYPLLKALSHDHSKIIVINIDAHADTRNDDAPHSGTPFRQFANEFPGEFHLFQIGLHPFANSFSTLSPLEKGRSDVLWKKDFSSENLVHFFEKIQLVADEKAFILFSLDADALSGFEVPGVSAVNPAGLSRDELLLIWRHYSHLNFTHAPVMGIYELNPAYDTLAGLSMKTVASFVFESFSWNKKSPS